MRKLPICLITAVTTLAAAGSMPATAYAATGTYSIPGGKMIVIGGSMNGANCGQSFPGVNIPGIQLPGGNGPCANFPCPHKPDNSLPLPGQPDGTLPGYPDGTLPGYPDGTLPGYPDGTLPGYPDGTLPGYPDNTLPGQPGDTPDLPDAGGSQDEFANQVVNLVNEERARAGLRPLTVQSGVAGAAQVRAKEIERSFSHTRPDGSSFNTALTAAGVNFRGAGENIAYGQNSPQKVMEGWMNSSGHRANILNASYTSIGVGHYRSASGVDYWTQLFIQ